MFKRKHWRYLILDEAHMIKNWKSQRWQCLLNFSSRRRLLITGALLCACLLPFPTRFHSLLPSFPCSLPFLALCLCCVLACLLCTCFLAHFLSLLDSFPCSPFVSLTTNDVCCSLAFLRTLFPARFLFKLSICVVHNQRCLQFPTGTAGCLSQCAIALFTCRVLACRHSDGHMPFEGRDHSTHFADE